MKTTEFRKLISEEIRKVIVEVNMDALSKDMIVHKDQSKVKLLIGEILKVVKGKMLFGDETIKDVQTAPSSDESQTVLMIIMESGKRMMVAIYVDAEEFPAALKARVGRFSKGGLSSKEPKPEDSDVYLSMLNILFPNSEWKKEDITIK